MVRLALPAFTLAALLALGAAAEESGEAHPDSEHSFRNVTQLFVGGTTEHGESTVAVGISHEYRLHRYLGVGGFAEYAAGSFDKWIFGVPIYVHPWRELRLLVAPGLEHEHGEQEFLLRAGVGYEFELSEHWRLAPEVSVDFVDGEEAVVYGLSLGYAW